MIKNFSFLILFLIAIVSCTPKQVEWTAIGDSITYLNDHPDETGNRVEKGYLTRVIEQFPRIKYVNKGYNGWTAGKIAEKIEELDLNKADIYTVFLGTNDWWAGRPIGNMDDYTGNTGAGTLYGSFRIILDKLHQLNSNAKIILITPMQRGDFVYLGNFSNNAYGSYREKNGQNLADFANAVKEIGKKENLVVVDLFHDSGINQGNIVRFKRLTDPGTGLLRDYIYPDFIDVPFDASTSIYPYPEESIDMTYDGLHPSDKGNEIIARMLVQSFGMEFL